MISQMDESTIVFGSRESSKTCVAYVLKKRCC